MGEIADGIIDGIFDEETGEYIDDELSHSGGPGYPRTQNKSYIKWVKDAPAEAKIRLVRKELAILIKSKQKQGIKNAVGSSRQEINLKYGKGWRERGLIVNSDNQWKELSKY